MLEQEITLLREEIALLREALQKFAQTLNQPKAEAPKAEAFKVEDLFVYSRPKAEERTVEELFSRGPVIDDLQELCMQIVRADRSKKDAVKNTIAKYGAETLVGVAAADYPALFADLKAL